MSSKSSTLQGASAAGAAAVLLGTPLAASAFISSGSPSRSPALRAQKKAEASQQTEAQSAGTGPCAAMAFGAMALAARNAARQPMRRSAAVISAKTARASMKSWVGPSAAKGVAAEAFSTVSMQSAAVAAPPTKAVSYEVGEKLHGWTCVRSEYIKEFSCSGYLFQHDKTGAELMSMVQPADENKTFSVVFRTPPENSNGIAHVLEHSVLCGSRKYPLKEPFVELMKSSLQTFLNAMTFPDRTCYPVASCNLKDFYNLIDVYLDAVFHPRAVSDPKVLAQEGWHYEVESKDAPLSFKGVVFNEMKGVYSDPDSAHGRLANQSLFPDNQYGVDSGGDPKVIPSLTFDYFKDFHSKYYHPSNAKFWFYGDDPADGRLELLDKFLSEFSKIEVDSSIAIQPLFKEAKKVQGEFAVGEEEDISNKTMVSVNWIVSEGKEDLQTSLAMQFLNYLIMGTPASPLYKALVDSGLGSRVIGGGLDDSMLQSTFSVGLKDLKPEDAPKVEELVTQVLTELADKGFENDAIKAAINTIEFQNRELNTGSFPKGLALLFAANSNWNYGKDPFEPLSFDGPLLDLKSRLEKGESVFEDLIRKKLLQNSHKVIVETNPSKDLEKRIADEEKAVLEAHRKTLDGADIENLMKETALLKEIQEKPDSPEAMQTVPRLELSDIAKETPTIPTEVKGSAPKALVHALPTSGVVYMDIAFDVSRTPVELLPLLPLFTSALRQLGTAKGDFVNLTRRIGMSTGGISASTVCNNKRGDPSPRAYLILRGKAMSGQVPELVDLAQEIVLTVNLDNKERIVQLANQLKSGAQGALISSGHIVAARQLGAQTTEAGWLNAQWSGMKQYDYLSKLLAEIEGGGWDDVHKRLQTLQACIFNQAACSVVNLTADAENLGAAEAAMETFTSTLPADETSQPVLLKPALGRRAEGIIVPTQVNYVGKGGNVYQSGYEYHGSAQVISKLLGATYLWDKVRVSGGAYGGFCAFDPRSGDFKYLSYRDPNLGKTLEAYDGASTFLKELELGEDELTKAIIGCMGDVDAYMLPDAKGYQAMIRYLLEEDDEYRQKVRDEILSTSMEDFKKFASVLSDVADTGGISVVGSKEACEEAKDEFGLELTTPFAA